MTEPSRVQVGLAGWSNPPAERANRADANSHLAHYAQHFSCVEINSSFYRAHQSSTYARWREDTPPHFRFSVKMPKSITHESHLKRCTAEVERFYEEISSLRTKLAVVLVQLPPSLEFEARTVASFFNRVPRLRGTRVVCEPRHASWFSRAADSVLKEAKVSRVAADPARFPVAEIPMGYRRFAYFRWHGSPRLYYSKYSELQLSSFIAAVRSCGARDTWCVFDNTALYAAWGDALRLIGGLRSEQSA
jgi:uncharacterized protein YecE (DUF72 family)